MKPITEKALKIALIMLVLVSFIIPNFVYADGLSFSDAQSFIEKGKEQAGTDGNGLSQKDLNDVGKQFSDIAKILTYIGAGILVVATVYMGIKYMVAPPEKQAQLKEQLIGLVVSAVVIFGAYFIWSTLYDLLNGAFAS